MSDTGVAIWWVFVAGVLALAVVLTGFVAALVISQRRVLRLEREHARQLLEAQEAERAWVAREVHDDVLQRVAALRAELEGMAGQAQRGPVGDLQKLEALRGELDDLSHVLRGVAHRLHPSVVERAGLVAGLRSLAEEVERTHRLTVGLDVPEQAVPLRWDAALAAYRITQEALRNVARHSGCREAAVALDLEDGYVRLRIEDRGCGFDADGPGPGLGLVAMQERAVLAGGEFDLRSEKGQGTRIDVSFPLAGA